MPPYQMVTHGFIKDVFEGKKKLLKLTDVKFIQVPKYDEISVKNLYAKFIKIDDIS